MHTHGETYTQPFRHTYTTEAHFLLKRTKVNLKGVENKRGYQAGKGIREDRRVLAIRDRVCRTQGYLLFDENDNF